MNIEDTLKKIFEKVKKPVTFFDCETTGLEISKDDIIQIYIATYDNNGLSEMNAYFNTDRLIAPGAQEKHGISKDMLEGKPYFKESAADVFKFFEGNSVICGYNHVRFDIPILIENLLRSEITSAASLLKRETIDVLIEYRRLNANDLTSVFERITGESMSNAHEAQSDIYATSRILEELFKADDEITPVKSTKVDVDGFFQILPTGLAFAKGKYNGQLLKEIPHNDVIGYLSWIGEKADSMSSHTKLVALTLKGRLQQSNKEVTLKAR